MRFGSSCCAAVLAFALWPGIARAGDATLAEALFQDAKQLMEAGDYARACPKLAASYAEDPATGSLFALARCEEQLGKLASAWTKYIDVAGRARQEGRPDRAQAATDLAAALAPRLDKLTVRVAPEVASTPGLTVTRDGAPLPQAAWDTAVPVDPGEHVIEAKAPGKAPFRQALTFGPEGDQQVVDIPPLGPEAVPPSGAVRARESDANASANPPYKTIGLVVGGAGLVALGIGTVFGLRAKNLNEDSTKNGECDSTGCSPEGLELNEDARSAGNLSTGLFIAGGVLAATGVTLFIVGSMQSDTAKGFVTLTPAVATRGAGLSLRGKF